MLESIHGSVFDVNKKAAGNIVETFWITAEMFAQIGAEEAAQKIMEDIGVVSETGIVTPDVRSKATTNDISACVIDGITKGSTSKAYKQL